MARLFFAVWPPDHVVATLRALPRKDQRGVRFLPPDMWHATLRFLGEAQIDDVVDAMRHVDLPAVTARVGPAVDLLGSHSVIAPVHGLDALAATVVAATTGVGDLPPRHRYIGHITIARVKQRAVVRAVVGLPCDTEFDVGEVALVESRLRPHGSDYATVASWPTR